MSETLDVLESRWRLSCRILFGKEACTMAECAEWLSESIEPLGHRKSSLSGREVISVPTAYCENSKWLSFEEADFSQKFDPLNINEIKDIDSLIGALSERFYYSGNIFFGNSSHIERSSNINDSHYMYQVGRHGNSKHVAYSAIGRFNEDCFGCNGIGESSFCIKSSCRSFRNKRCFEAWICTNCSDCYYSSSLVGCADCLFCFNMHSRRRCIGNLSLDSAKYMKIKEKLLDEMIEILSKKKRLPTLVDIVAKAQVRKPAILASKNEPDGDDKAPDKGKIEQAFLDTTRLLFGRPLEGGVDNYSKWLKRHTHETISGYSAESGKELFMPNAVGYPNFPKNRLLSEKEAFRLGEHTSISEQDVDELSMENAHEKIGDIAYFNTELFEGNNHNNIECSICFDSVNNYRNSLLFYSKDSAYSFWPRNCNHVFGCDSSFSSEFSINCYSCINQIRCFEIDCCGYCSDLYFGHNCENVHDSMFCFNVKNRRNCIGNAQYPKEQYGKIKSSILEQIVSELERKKDFGYDIYNVGCMRE